MEGMITMLGDRIARAMVRAGAVPEDEQELYSYGFFLLLSKGLFLLVTASCGAMLGVLWESVLFYALFTLLRGYAGGIHAEKEGTCLICTTASGHRAYPVAGSLQPWGSGAWAAFGGAYGGVCAQPPGYSGKTLKP